MSKSRGRTLGRGGALDKAEEHAKSLVSTALIAPSTAYVSVPTSLAFSTPPVPVPDRPGHEHMYVIATLSGENERLRRAYERQAERISELERLVARRWWRFWH